MTKVFLACAEIEGRSAPLIEELRHFLEGGECELVLLPADRSELALVPRVAECSVVVIIVESAAIDPSLSEIVRLAKIAGKRIVVLRGPDEAAGELPIEVEKYGSALVPWDRAEIRRAICEGEDSWKLDDGTERDLRDTERHKCRPRKKAPVSDAAA